MMTDRPEAHLATAFADMVRRWAERLDAPASSRQAAGKLAQALIEQVMQGHVCLPVTSGTDPGSLLASKVIGTPGSGCPLILDGDRLMLARHFEDEATLAHHLRALNQPILWPPTETPALSAALAAAFPHGGQQRVAAALALCQRLLFISGGPGTGKTTTVAGLLGVLLTREPALRVALAAPTGKAAARMIEALRSRAATLPQTLQARLPDQASTVHRLLGLRPDGSCRHHAAAPLPLDLLIVDEASMLDLTLARQLVTAMPTQGRLILLGDKDQLAAVEAGAVFAELTATPALYTDCRERLADLCGAPPDAPEANPGDFADCCVWLNESHRFTADSAIGRLAAAINQGDTTTAERLLGGHHDALDWLDPAEPTTIFDAAVSGYAAYFDALRQRPEDTARVFAAFDRYRVLCAVREGPLGSTAMNAHLLQQLARLNSPHGSWLPGQPLMVTRNDPLQKRANGDIGLFLPAPDGRWQIAFPEAGGGYGWLPPERLSAHETAFALTVHKAQGSEYDAICLLLPDAPSPMLNRELLYTGLTRARQRFTLAATPASLLAACNQRSERRSTLRSRLFGNNGQATA